jgi:hypothetical protein
VEQQLLSLAGQILHPVHQLGRVCFIAFVLSFLLHFPKVEASKHTSRLYGIGQTLLFSGILLTLYEYYVIYERAAADPGNPYSVWAHLAGVGTTATGSLLIIAACVCSALMPAPMSGRSDSQLIM